MTTMMKCMVCGEIPAEKSDCFTSVNFGAAPRESDTPADVREKLEQAAAREYIGEFTIGWHCDSSSSAISSRWIILDEEHPELPRPPLVPLQAEFVFCGFACLRQWFTMLVDTLEQLVQCETQRQCHELRNPAGRH